VGVAHADTLGTISVATVEGDRICHEHPITFGAPAGATIVEVHNLARPRDVVSSGIVIDSMLFDGAGRCNDRTHDWRFVNTLPLRGDNVVRNSVFYDTPSENLTICRTLVEGNVGVELGGSFLHISCGDSAVGPYQVRRNRVAHSNLVPDAIMRHSEGLITFSANARLGLYEGNAFVFGGEGVFGRATPDDLPVRVVEDCYAHFPRLIRFVRSDPTGFHASGVRQYHIGD
jgi:hypothetical protein